jgi:hypothetical protein
MVTIGWRPREGWRVFAGEVGIIVVGVLLALGAQAGADAYKWSQDVKRSKADLDAEILGNVINGAERIAVAPCLSARIEELGRALGSKQGTWRAMPFRPATPDSHTLTSMPVVYRMPNRVWTVDVWEQAKGVGLFNHMKAEDLALYSAVYEQIGDLRQINSDEQMQGPKLSFLGYDGTLEPAARVQALTTLAELDTQNRALILIAGQVADTAVTLDSKLPAAARLAFAKILAGQRKLRGSCVDDAAAWKVLDPLIARDKA